MTILVYVINQELRLATPFKTLIDGTQEFIKFKFLLDNAWTEITTFAQFTQNDVAYNVYLDEDNCVYLPPEINAGTFTLMLYGTGNNTIGTSNYLTLKVSDNILIEDAQSTEVTQSLYSQLVNIVDGVNDNINTITTARTSDVGKYLKVKSVNNGKVSAWEFDEGGSSGGEGGSGQDGQDGYSPTITVTNITGGHRVAITDVNGTKRFDVMDGTKGSNGVSPTVTVVNITGGHRVSITDATGTKTFDVMDGSGSGGGTSVAIDKTLTIEDAAADAKAVGDRFNGLFTEKATDNLFNKDVATVGSYVNPYTGDVVEYDGVFRELIEFEEGSYTFLAQPGVFGANAYTVAMFDENRKFVSYTQGTHTEIDSMSSIVTVAFSSQATATAKYFNINGTTDILNILMVIKGAQYPTEYVPYGTYKTIDGLQISKSQIIDLDDETNPLKGKIISLNGDSIAAGTGYQGGYGKIIAEENAMTYENIAVGGGTVAYVSSNVHCISRTIANMRSDADYVILDGGGNDADSGVSLGTLSTGYDATLDDTTFAGAFENMLKSAIARFPNKKIGYVFVHKCAYLFSSTVKDSYYDIAKSACEKWGIPYCDLNTQTPPLNYIANLKTNYTANGDGYHPNEQGYKLFYVPKITAWLKTL